MANLQVPDEGERALLERLRDNFNAAVDNCNIHLYQSDLAFDADNVLSDYSAIESDFDGYASKQLTAWGVPSVPDGSGRAYVIETLRTWIVTGLTNLPQTVYGYYVSNDNTGELLWVQRAAVPVALSLVGDFYAVIPKFTFRSEF